MRNIKNRAIALILILAISVSFSYYPEETVKAANMEESVLIEHAERFTYLGGTDTEYHGYLKRIEERYYRYSCKGVFPIEPISYRIDDYDQDGQKELLIVNMDDEFRVKIEIYEVENNHVVLKDSLSFISCEGGNYPIQYPPECVHAGVYWEEDELNCFTYNYKDSKIIAIEEYSLAYISADGVGYNFVMVNYNGNELSIVNEAHGAGSDFSEEFIEYMNEEFAKMGIILDFTQICDRKKKVSDYIDNKIVFASAKTETKENVHDTIYDIIFNSTEDKIENISDITFTMKNTGGTVSNSDFNMNIYRANFLADESHAATKGLNDNMAGDTPSEILIRAAQKNGLQCSVMTWEAVTAALDAVDSPSSLVDFSMQEKDLYAAVILDLLQVSVESDIASSCQDAISDAKKVLSKVKSWMQESFNLDIAKKEHFNAMTYEQKKSLISKTEDDFKNQYDKDLGSVNKVLSNINNVLAAADCIETYLENVATMCELAKISDSMRMVINDMYTKCPESKKALKSALKDCVSIINAGTDQFIDKIAACTEMYVGMQAVKFGVDEIWEGIKKQINFANPTLFILTECYKVDKYVVNELFKTDAISEQYMNMLAVTEVEDLIIKVLQSSKEKFKNKPLEDNAKVYLSAIDYLYAGLDYDCKSAYKFVDAVDDAFVSQIAALLGAGNHEGVKNSIKGFQQSYYTNYALSILSSWIYGLTDDYPNSGLYERYEALLDKNYEKTFTKKYGVACPVDVYVYDKDEQLVAYVIDNKPYSTGDITVVVEGTAKTLYFYDSDKYQIRYIGTGVGDMEVSMEEYDQKGNIIRQVDYCKVPLSEEITYETEIKEDVAITPLKDKEGKIIIADYDTDVLQGNNRKVQIQNGMLLLSDGPVFSAEIPLNDEVSVYAYVPDGYIFERWISDAGTDVFENPASQVTTFKMPNNDINISAVLTKKQIKVEKVTLSLADASLNTGNTLQLTVSVFPEKAENKTLQWTSSDEKVAIVDNNGLVTAVGAGGKATITVKSTDGSDISASCIVVITDDLSNPQPTPNPGPIIESFYYIIQFDGNSGTKLSRKTLTLTFDDNLGILPKIQRKNYKFKGWYTQKNGGDKVNSASVLNVSTTLYAQWEEVSKPAKVKKLVLLSKKSGQVKVNWKKVSGAFGYQVVYSASKKFADEVTKKVFVSSISRTINNLKKGKTYYIKVRAYKIDSAGNKIYGAFSVKKIKVKK